MSKRSDVLPELNYLSMPGVHCKRDHQGQGAPQFHTGHAGTWYLCRKFLAAWRTHPESGKPRAELGLKNHKANGSAGLALESHN
ncbi:hypothetical protein HYFRA_00008200 [Hymenoscyphus fraxineus]|uniref:Uncharacterized protein n=1 Tax=Hymenoscyphus fraxineus TaxID=746836 RepID=A0A9N9L8J1_9HELO|nr:hypothetical protein HYFRA_00008200 [Hymenoscyphus fraxineus]